LVHPAVQPQPSWALHGAIVASAVHAAAVPVQRAVVGGASSWSSAASPRTLAQSSEVPAARHSASRPQVKPDGQSRAVWQVTEQSAKSAP
jgi:hypothetical protein